VKRAVKELNVSFIQFWFPDVLGFLKSFAVTPSELEEGMTEGMGFDGSSIEGFARIQESDMIAKPDPTTFQLVPWRGVERPVAECSVTSSTRMELPMRETLGMFSRGFSRRSRTRVHLLHRSGTRVLLLQRQQKHRVLDAGGYFDARPLDMGSDLRRDTIFTLQSMGLT